jgi:hypothetical protein
MTAKPVLPPWAKPGCEVLHEYEAPFESGHARGVARWVDYLDAKGNSQTTMQWVKWGDDLYAEAMAIICGGYDDARRA